MSTDNNTGVTYSYNMTEMDMMEDWMNGTGTMFNHTTDEDVAGMDVTTITTMLTTMLSTESTTPKRCIPAERPMCNPYMIAAYNFAKYGILGNYAVGIPGSAITMILLARMRPFNSASVWLFGMAFLDCFNLTFRAVRTIFLDVTSIMSWVDVYCRVYYIGAMSTEHAGYLILVGLTVERFIAVWFPLKMNVWCKKRWATLGICCILVFCLAWDMHLIKTMRVGVNTGYCVVRLKYRPVWEYMYMDVIQGLTLKVLPVFLLGILNALIIFKLRRNKGIRAKISDDQAKEKERQQRQINRMLTAATLWFFFCVAPDLLFRYTRHLWGDRGSEQVYVIKWVCMNAFASLVLYNHSGNFILYIIAARRFRSELVRLMTCGAYTLDYKSKASKSSKTSKTSTQVTSTK